MKELLLFLLLPVAAFSGWYLAVKKDFYNYGKNEQKNKEKKIVSSYFSGLNYLLNEQQDKALNVFLNLLDADLGEDDEILEIQLMLANLFRRRGEVDRAIKIHQSIFKKPKLPEEYKNILALELAKDYISAGLLDRAEIILLDLVSVERELESSLNLLHKIYQESKDWKQAIKFTEKLQAISGTDYSEKISNYNCEIACDCIENNNFDLAKKYLKKALDVNNNCARANIILGDLEFSNKNYKAALKAFENVNVQQKEYLSEVINKIFLCYKHLNKLTRMSDYWKKVLSEKPHVIMLIYYIEFLVQTKGESEALKCLREHLKTSPSILGLQKLINLSLSLSNSEQKNKFEYLSAVIEKIIQKKYYYRCSNCGLSSKLLEWQCPGCKEWNKLKPISFFELS